jgi:CubicO group peptidase (beta-lactamase class C family)
MPRARCILGLICAVLLLAGCVPTAPRTEEPPASTTDPAKADAVMKIVRDTMAEAHLKAVIVRVTVDGREVVTRAVGDSMTNVPATTNMHFRNGAVAISYVSTLLLILVDEKKVSLDDKLSKWLPEVPHADRVTLGQLAQMTSGYVDYVIGNTEFSDALYRDPFRQWEPDQILGFATSKPLLYEPGTNWNYAHTNYVLLGRALEKATGQDMPQLLEDKVLRPLGLTNTANSFIPEIPAPVLQNGRSAGQDPHPARLHHVYGVERQLHLRHGHRDLRRLATAESVVRRRGRCDGLPSGQEDLNGHRRHLPTRGVRREGRLSKARPTSCSSASPRNSPRTTRRPRLRNNLCPWHRKCCSSTTSTSRPRDCSARRSPNAATT